MNQGLAHRARGLSRLRVVLTPLRGVPAVCGELLLLAWVVGFVCAYRLLHLESLEVGGDALKVWEFARHLVHGGELPEKLNHHTSRFGLVLPAMGVQRIWGSQATSYFLAPVIASVVSHSFVYLTVRRLGGVVSALIAVGLLIQFPPMVRASSQVLPETFGPAYVAVAYYFAVVFHDSRNRWQAGGCLLLSALFMFGAYGSKMVYLYFAPGLALLVWLGGKRKSAAEASSSRPRSGWGRLLFALRRRGLLVPLALAAVVVLLLLAEWVLVSRTTGSMGGRLEVMTGSHASRVGKGPLIHSWEDFFQIYEVAPHAWTRALVAGGMAGLGLFAIARDRRSVMLIWALVIFLALQTFGIRRLDPLTAWMAPHPRYLSAVSPMLAIVVGIFLNDACRMILTRWGWLRGRWKLWVRTPLILSACGVLYLSAGDLSAEWDAQWGKRGAWHRTQRDAQSLSRTFRSGLPIYSPSARGKPVWATGAVLLDPELLRAEDGTLRSHRDFVRRFKRGLLMASQLVGDSYPVQSRAVNHVAQRRIRSGKCHTRMHQSGRNYRIQPRGGKKCISLLEELKAHPERGKPAKHRRKKAARKKKGARRGGRKGAGAPENVRRSGEKPTPNRAPGTKLRDSP